MVGWISLMMSAIRADNDSHAWQTVLQGWEV